MKRRPPKTVADAPRLTPSELATRASRIATKRIEARGFHAESTGVQLVPHSYEGAFEPTREEDFDAFAASVAELVARAKDRRTFKRGRLQIVPGWLDAPEVPWERVPRFPREEAPPVASGAFRTAPIEPEERVLARRRKRTALEATIAWLASRPGFWWRDQPHEIAVTDSFVYTRTHDGVVRLPLAMLRTLQVSKSGDAIATFGRRTRLLLLARDECPVLTLLSARMTAADERQLRSSPT